MAYARDAELLDAQVAQDLLAKYEDALKGLNGLIASIQRKINTSGKAPRSVREDGSDYGLENDFMPDEG